MKKEKGENKGELLLVFLIIAIIAFVKSSTERYSLVSILYVKILSFINILYYN